MGSINNVNLCGRLTADIEIRITQSGKKVSYFTLAVARDKEKADFINCVAWGKTAEILEKYTRKGNKINVQGRIQTRTSTAQDGRKFYMTEVIVGQIELLESIREQAPKPEEEPEEPFYPESDNSHVFNTDGLDLPF